MPHRIALVIERSETKPRGSTGSRGFSMSEVWSLRVWVRRGPRARLSYNSPQRTTDTVAERNLSPSCRRIPACQRHCLHSNCSFFIQKECVNAGFASVQQLVATVAVEIGTIGQE